MTMIKHPYPALLHSRPIPMNNIRAAPNRNVPSIVSLEKPTSASPSSDCLIASGLRVLKNQHRKRHTTPIAKQMLPRDEFETMRGHVSNARPSGRPGRARIHSQAKSGLACSQLVLPSSLFENKSAGLIESAHRRPCDFPIISIQIRKVTAVTSPECVLRWLHELGTRFLREREDLSH